MNSRNPLGKGFKASRCDISLCKDPVYDKWGKMRLIYPIIILFLLIGAFTLLLFATSKSWIFYDGGDDK